MMRHDYSQLHADTVFALLERKRMLDAAWVVCWVSLVAAAAVPWFLNILPIDLERAATFVFVSALGYLVFAAITDRLTSQMAVATAMRVMPLVSIVLMGALWHLVGGIDNPIFLVAFVLPVIISGSTAMSRHAQMTAFLSVVVVFMVALAGSSDLRWYLAGGTPWIWQSLDGVAAILPASAEVFPEVRTSPAYQFTVLATFTVTQFLAAFLATPLSTLLRRLDTRIQVSHQMLNEVQGLFHAVLSAEPDPSVIVYADSLQVAQASDSFFKRMLVRPSEIVGKSLPEIVKFEQAEEIRRALTAAHGEIPFAVYRVHGEVRIANINFYRTEHRGTAYIYVGWQEITDLYYLQSAFDTVEDPIAVVGTDARLHYANRPARELFGDLYFGMPVEAAPDFAAIVREPSGVSETEDEAGYQSIAGQPYDVRRLVGRMPGDAGSCTIVWLHCVSKEEALFEQAVRDPLTGIYNRRYFYDAIARHVAKSKSGRSLACAYFDLDNFKPINDSMGHAAGDAALIGFVNAVKGQLRAIDVFARLGGDEFAVLFVNCDLDVASAAIGRIRAGLDADGWMFEGNRHPLKFSAGLAACHPDDDVAALLERTDKAVYAAKAAGKGRSATEI